MQIFGKRRFVEILLQLQGEPKNVIDLLSATGGSATTLENRISELINAGLVCEERQKSHPFKRVLNITNKGEQLVKTFSILEEMMSEIKVEKTKGALNTGQRWLLAMLYAIGGKIRGSTRLQKLSFLMKKQLNLDKQSFYEFSPEKFGPFSGGLSEDMERMGEAGLVRIDEEVFEPKKLLEDWVICYTYSLTEEGTEKARKIFDEMPEDVKSKLALLKPFNEILLSDLIHHVYLAYPQECKVKLSCVD
jgi:DNA-binding HxlR family transcriptional regulator